MLFKLLLLGLCTLTYVQPKVHYIDTEILDPRDLQELNDVISELKEATAETLRAAEKINNKHDLEIITDEELEALEGATDKLKKLVNKAIEKGKAKLLKIKDKIVAQAGVIVDKIKEKIANQFSGFVQTLNDYKEKAKKLGIDIVKCVKDAGQSLIDIPKQFIKGIIKCGTDKIDEGKAIINDAKTKVENTINKVKALAQEYKECSKQSTWASAKCKAKAAAKIAGAVTSFPADITSTVTDAITFVATLYPSLEKCGLDQVTAAITNGKAVLTGATECIESKITPPALQSLIANSSYVA